MSTGHMIWKDTRVRVRGVVEESRIDETGVRDGWMATTDDFLNARMFYPADMFTFEPEQGENREEQEP